MNVKFKNLREPAHKIKYVQDAKEKPKKRKKQIPALPRLDTELSFVYFRQLSAFDPADNNIVAVLEADDIAVINKEEKNDE